jgi:hypothetical protein
MAQNAKLLLVKGRTWGEGNVDYCNLYRWAAINYSGSKIENTLGAEK